MRTIDLNCDMGESYGAWRMGNDEAIMPHITSANVACGAHAGDPTVMARTIRLAHEHGVAVGAHPGYPDILGFGRRHIALTPEEVSRWVLYQLGALSAIAHAEGVALAHVKPHGALYNEASVDDQLAKAIAGAVSKFSRSLPLVCLPASSLEAAALALDLSVRLEGFVDRSYEPNGLLTDRKIVGAVREDPILAAQQAIELSRGSVTCTDGSQLRLTVDTLCVHGDTPGAVEIAKQVHAALVQHGFTIASLNL